MAPSACSAARRWRLRLVPLRGDGAFGLFDCVALAPLARSLGGERRFWPVRAWSLAPSARSVAWRWRLWLVPWRGDGAVGLLLSEAIAPLACPAAVAGRGPQPAEA